MWWERFYGLDMEAESLEPGGFIVGKSEVANEFQSLSQLTIALLLLAMVLMRDTLDSELIQAICLACLLSLVITEVELSRDQDFVADINTNSAGGNPSPERFNTATGTPVAAAEEFSADDSPSHHAYAEPEADEQGQPDRDQPSIPSYRRPITAYSSIPDEAGSTDNREIRWKPMPPRSVVPTKNPSTKETHTLSIRFVD